MIESGGRLLGVGVTTSPNHDLLVQDATGGQLRKDVGRDPKKKLE